MVSGCSSKSPRRSVNSQGGAILVFFATVMIVLLGFVALVIDTGVGESGRAEEQVAVQNAALAGMSTYLEALKTPSANQDDPYAQARTAAKTKAEQILATSNRITSGYRLNPSARIELGEEDSGDGEIVFGRMVWALATPAAGQPANPDVAACSQDNVVKVPCFIPAPAVGVPQPATAIQVRTASESNPIRTTFARVFGADRYEVGGSAIATLIPQNYLFLLDLSSSMVDQSYKRVGVRDGSCIEAKDETSTRCRESNWPQDPACYLPASGSYFSYDVDPELASNQGCDAIGTPGTCACFSDPETDKNCLLIPRDKDSLQRTETDGFIGLPDRVRWLERRRARRIFAGYSSWWETSEADPYVIPFPPACQPKNDTRAQHPTTETDSPPRSFYRVVEPLVGRDLVTGGETEQGNPLVLVDFGQDASAASFQAQPEPLRSVLDATNDAMDFIEKRAVSADRFFLTGFDEEILAARTTCTSESANTCAPGNTLVAPDSLSFRGFLSLTNVKPGAPGNWEAYASSNTKPYHFLNRSFFPRTGYNTDILLALWKTYEELVANPSSVAAKNLVFLVTDGIANCRFVDTSQDGTGPYEFEDLNEYVAKRECDGNPSTIGVTVIEAIRQMNRDLERRGLRKSVVQMFQERGVSVSVILIGANVQPHHLIRPSTTPGGQAGCLTTSEAVYGGIKFVDWSTSSQGQSYTCEPGRAGCSASGLRTSALAADAREALTNPQGPVTLPISNLLYEELVAPTKGAWIPILPVKSSLPANFSDELKSACNTAYNPDPNAIGEDKSPRIRNLTLEDGTKVTDGQGRLLFDPLARTQKQQIIEQVEQVLGGGYVLVEPAMRAQ